VLLFVLTKIDNIRDPEESNNARIGELPLEKGRLETFKYRGSELICEASGPDFRTTIMHATACGLALDETVDN
jgi:hypothetical protein